MFFTRKNTSKLSDLELVSEYQKDNDTKYVGELFNRYAHLVLGVCLKYFKDSDKSQDALMQIFEKLIDDLKRQDIQNFKSWLHVVSKNYCLMQLRKKDRLHLNGEAFETAERTLEATNDLDEIELKEKELSHLEEAIEQLNPEQRNCIKLFYIERKCYTEVSENTGFTQKQVKSYIQNGKRNLKLIITQNREH